MKKFYVLAFAMIFGFALSAQTILIDEGFEGEAGASWPTGWTTFSASDLSASDQTPTDYTAIGEDPTWFVGDAASFGGDDPQYIHSGTYAAMLGYTAGSTGNAYHYLLSPEVTLEANTTLTFWHWYFNNAGSSWFTNTYVLLFDGTSWTTLQSFIGADGAANNEYDSQVSIDLSAYSGTVQIAFVFEYTDGYQYMVDDILMSATSTVTTYDVTFNVDMRDSILSGYFNPETDTVYVTGSYNTWAEPGTDIPTQYMADADGDSIYTYTRVDTVGAFEYKYFKGVGWANGEWNGGDNRTFEIVDADVVLNDVFGVAPVAGVSELNANALIGPNPTNGILFINADENFNVQVIDMTGRVILSTEMQNNQAQIDLSAQQAGMYIVRLSNENGTSSYKVVKK